MTPTTGTGAPAPATGGGEGGVLGQGGSGGPEVAQVQGEQGTTGSQGATEQQQPSQLASTGFDVRPLLVIGLLCIAASFLLLRRRRTNM